MKKRVFLDIDGVLTRIYDKDGNKDPHHFMNLKPDLYGPVPELVEKIRDFTLRNGAEIIITSNWRKYGPKDYFTYGGYDFQSPLPKARKLLGEDIIAGILPPEHGIKKAECLMLFEEDYGAMKEGFVIFDDMNEGYGEHPIYHRHFVRTNPSFGITDKDLELAQTIIDSKR